MLSLRTVDQVASIVSSLYRGEAALRSPAPCIQLLKLCADNNIDIQVSRLVGELDHETAAELAKTLEDQLRLDLGPPFGGETIMLLPREGVEPVALPAWNTGF